MRILENWDVSSLYPSLAEIFGYLSRNQENTNDYIKIKKMRMDAKHGKLTKEFLEPLGLTNDDLKDGLKLPINAYTGALRAVFNKLYDPLQGFSICTTGQLLILQLIHDLQEIPTIEMVSANTDAVMYTIEEEYKELAHKVLEDWQIHTGLELEEDKIVKIIMRDVNNYAEIVQKGDNNYEVHYKGGELTRGNHKFTWNKEKKIFEYSFSDSLKSNSMSIVSEALLKFLLFDIPIRTTIEKCDDIFRFQIISHLGSTYDKMVQESEDCDLVLQRNNRIYAGKKKSGNIVKVKPNGRRDSLANCPPNPIVDNSNKCKIEDINKEWYIEFAEKKANDFIGVKRLEEYKKDELIEKANNYGIDFDKKIKKSDLIELIKNYEKQLTNKLEYNTITNERRNELMTKQELEVKLLETENRLEQSLSQNEKLVEKLKEKENNKMNISMEDLTNDNLCKVSLLKKLNEFRKKVRERKFVFDKELPNNLGGGEYYSIDQFYNAVQEIALEVGLDFAFETTDLVQFDKELTKPSGKLPIHVATVCTVATFTDIDTGYEKEYVTIAQGSDTIDKAIASASSMAFRNWFYKNFTPKDMKEDELDDKPEEQSKPKVPVYVPEQKKEEIKKEVVKQVQQEDSDKEDIKEICENIMKIKEKTNNPDYGESTLQRLMSGSLSSADIMEIDLKIKNKMESVGLV